MTICENCARREFCGCNKQTYCTGFVKTVQTEWSADFIYYSPTIETKCNDTWLRDRSDTE